MHLSTYYSLCCSMRGLLLLTSPRVRATLDIVWCLLGYLLKAGRKKKRRAPGLMVLFAHIICPLQASRVPDKLWHPLPGLAADVSLNLASYYDGRWATTGGSGVSLTQDRHELLLTWPAKTAGRTYSLRVSRPISTGDGITAPDGGPACLPSHAAQVPCNGVHNWICVWCLPSPCALLHHVGPGRVCRRTFSIWARQAPAWRAWPAAWQAHSP